MPAMGASESAVANEGDHDGMRPNRDEELRRDAEEDPENLRTSENERRIRTMSTRCGVCGEETTEERTRRCRECGVVVHDACYGEDAEEDEGQRKEWTCDWCLHGVEEDKRREIKCVYCRQVATAVMRVASSAEDAANNEFAHVACLAWTPALVAAEARQEARVGIDQDDAYFANQVVTTASTPPCCFCHDSSGYRLQCRRVHCARWFHAHCAAQPNAGYLDVQSEPFPRRYAFCDRHREYRPDVMDMFSCVTTKPVSGVLLREAVTRLQRMQRKLATFTSVDEVISEIVHLLGEQCEQSLKISKSTPPAYSLPRLQVLQLALSHIPQLRRVYAVSTLSRSRSTREWLNSADLADILEKTFDPPRFVRKSAGPTDPYEVCQVCGEAFQERQHVFRCMGDNAQHVQHWACTKRQSSRDTREGSANASKKKSKARSLGVQATSKETTYVQRLFPPVSDGVMCGVCRAPVDASVLLASRQTTTRAEFDRRPSRFMFGGNFVNQPGGVLLTSSISTTNSRSRRSRSPSPSGKSAARGSKRAAPSNNGISEVVLQPIKMDRVNVQRTTRWLSCLAQVIKLMMRRQHKPVVNGGDGDTTVEVVASLQDTIDAVVRENGQENNTAHDAKAVNAPTSYVTDDNSNKETPHDSGLPASVTAYLEEAKNLVRGNDPYALYHMELAERMMLDRSGPGLSELNALIQEYTRFVYIKHTRAVQKARNEKRKRRELEAEEAREKERRRLDRQAELTLKKQMLAMRKRQRQHLGDH